jgi:hypothetical protein
VGRGRVALVALVLAVPIAQAHEPAAPAELRRGTEQTFLTYPEWFLVHSPAEYAAFIGSNPPSEFPYLGHLGQFWRGYAKVAGAARQGGYPTNPGYHVMILVIGASTTVEYGLKAAYERLVGRFTERLGPVSTEEDQLAARTAREYVEFIRVRPWYEFDFARRLRALWADTPYWGRGPLRKWERRYALTTEYLAKAAYGYVIERMTHASYAAEPTVTAVVLDRPPPPEVSLPELKVLDPAVLQGVLATVPRYAAFTDYARALARAGVEFREIAGNDTEILVSFIVPTAGGAGVDERVLFTEPILTLRGRTRVVVVVPVAHLSRFLRALDRPGAEVEHVYDY